MTDIKNTIYPILEQFNDAIKMREVRKLCEKIKIIGESSDLTEFDDYADKLLYYEQIIDIDNIEKMIADFPGFADEIISARTIN